MWVYIKMYSFFNCFSSSKIQVKGRSSAIEEVTNETTALLAGSAALIQPPVLTKPVPLQVCEAERANEWPGAARVLAGDGKMGGPRGELRPTGGGVGLLTDLLPHVQKPHPAAAHHEHWSVTNNVEPGKVSVIFKVAFYNKGLCKKYFEHSAVCFCFAWL